MCNLVLENTILLHKLDTFFVCSNKKSLGRGLSARAVA